MRVDVKDKHFNSVFTILKDKIETRGSSKALTIKGNQIREGGGRVLYEIRKDRIEDRTDRKTYWLKSSPASSSIEGKSLNFYYSGKRIRTSKGDMLVLSDEVDLGLAAVVALEYVTGRAFERGLSDLEKLGILLGGAEMILALEKDGLGLKNLGRFGFYNSLSPQAQNKLLLALGTKFAIQRGLSLRKVMKLVAFNTLEKETQKVLVKAYSGYRFLKRGNFSFLGKALIASSFDEMTMNRFVKFYAAKEYFEDKGVLSEPEPEVSQVPEPKEFGKRGGPDKPETKVRKAPEPSDFSGQRALAASLRKEHRPSTPIHSAPKAKKGTSKIIKYGGTFLLFCFILAFVGSLSNTSQMNSMQIIAIERTWLKVRTDGETIYEGTMNPGQKMDLSSDEAFHLWLGNAGGVKFVLNGREIQPLGRSGQVLRDYILSE